MGVGFEGGWRFLCRNSNEFRHVGLDEGLAVGVAGGWVIFWWVGFGGLGFVWLRS